MIDEHLVAFLRESEQISERSDEISVGEIPMDAEEEPLLDDYIWISFFNEEDQLDLDGQSGLTEYRADIEVVSVDLKRAKELSRLVKTRLQGHSGNFGTLNVGLEDEVTATVQAIYVDSKDDDYVPINQFSNTRMAVVAMTISIWADDAQDDFS
mgnify:CR=1 FL=1